MSIETTRIGVFTKNIGLGGSPVSLGGALVPAIVGVTYGTETYVEREAVVATDDNIDALANTRVVRVISIGLASSGGSDFVEGVNFTVSDDCIDWSNAVTMQPPDQDTPLVIDGGGSWASTGVYDVVVTAYDRNSRQTLVGTTKDVTITDCAQTLSISWSPVKCASKYRVYIKLSSSETWYYTEVTAPTTSTTFTVLPRSSSTLPTATNACVRPGTGDTYYVDYYYSNTGSTSPCLTPKLYYDMAEVENDHGVGSPISNAARLILSRTDGAGCSQVMLCGYLTDTFTNMESALALLETEDVHVVGAVRSGFQVVQALEAHARNASSIAMQRERIGVGALEGGLSLGTTSTAGTYCYQAYALNSKYVCAVVPEGGEVSIDEKDADGNIAKTSVDPSYLAAAVIGTICALPDPAEPPTNKIVRGIKALGSRWNALEIDRLRDAGGLVVLDKNGVCKIYHGVTTDRNTVEAREANIVLADQYMCRDIRPVAEEFIGRKLHTNSLMALRYKVKNKLDNYVARKIIAGYDTNTLQVYQNPTVPTNVRVRFSYNCVYGINNVVFEYWYGTQTVT